MAAAVAHFGGRSRQRVSFSGGNGDRRSGNRWNRGEPCPPCAAEIRPRGRMDEIELEEIKREIVESRSLSIKTNNLINALSADLKSIAKRQQGYERRVFVNSATAYAVTI